LVWLFIMSKSTIQPSRCIVNVIGHAGAGKSTVCSYLERTSGFFVSSPSDVMRMRAREYGITLRGRADYVHVNNLIYADDPNAFFDMAFVHPRTCLDGQRAPLTVRRLKEAGAYVLALVGPDELLYERIAADVTRSGHRRPPTFEEYMADRAIDDQGRDISANTQAVIDMADFVISIDQPLHAVLQGVSRAMETIL